MPCKYFLLPGGSLIELAVGRAKSLGGCIMSIPASALIADDENHLRVYVRLILQELGVQEILEARNGREAVELFKRHRPDVVLMDINMPEMTGLKALRLILAEDGEAVVVMLTGHASRQLVETSERTGALHYIRKDTSREEISAILEGLFSEIFGEQS